jgi:hypothetical protein
MKRSFVELSVGLKSGITCFDEISTIILSSILAHAPYICQVYQGGFKMPRLGKIWNAKGC